MNMFPKINALKELSNGHQLLKIIKVFFEEQNFTSSYSTSINFDIIKTFFEGKLISPFFTLDQNFSRFFFVADNLGIKSGIDYEAAALGDENELGVVSFFNLFL